MSQKKSGRDLSKQVTGSKHKGPHARDKGEALLPGPGPRSMVTQLAGLAEGTSRIPVNRCGPGRCRAQGHKPTKLIQL